MIEVRVAELRQLFNAIDPSPFRERDLDPRAEEFIVDWARDLSMDKPWALVVHLDRPAGRHDEAAALREAIHEYFGQRAVASGRRLRDLFRRGRVSLVIAVAFLTASIAVGDVVVGYLGDGRLPNPTEFVTLANGRLVATAQLGLREAPVLSIKSVDSTAVDISVIRTVLNLGVGRFVNRRG